MFEQNLCNWYHLKWAFETLHAKMWKSGNVANIMLWYLCHPESGFLTFLSIEPIVLNGKPHVSQINNDT